MIQGASIACQGGSVGSFERQAVRILGAILCRGFFVSLYLYRWTCFKVMVWIVADEAGSIV